MAHATCNGGIERTEDEHANVSGYSEREYVLQDLGSEL